MFISPTKMFKWLAYTYAMNERSYVAYVSITQSRKYKTIVITQECEAQLLGYWLYWRIATSTSFAYLGFNMNYSNGATEPISVESSSAPGRRGRLRRATTFSLVSMLSDIFLDSFSEKEKNSCIFSNGITFLV